MVVFFSWRKPSFLGSKTQFIFSGGILRHICFYRKSETSPALAILVALRYRDKTGEGQYIDISMQDCVWATCAIEWATNYFLTGEIPQRMGNSNYATTPFSVYKTIDGYVAICIVTIGQWQAACRIIGREDLLEDERYATQFQRINHFEEINAIVEGWTKVRSTEEVVKAFQSADLPCSSVPTFAQVANDPHLLSRGMITEVDQVLSGRLKVPGSVFKLSRTPGNPNIPSPFLGQHNYEIYSNVLGYNEQEIKELGDEGVI
jgi:Predicted acyl-CoA transferases/carnitine dehydratase